MSNEKYLGNQNLKQAGSLSVGKSGGVAAFVELLDGSGVAVSPAGTTRIRSNNGILEKSINGAAYIPIGGDTRLIAYLSIPLIETTADDRGAAAFQDAGLFAAVTP